MENLEPRDEQELGRKVFLSHSSTDRVEVDALRAALEERGIACFLDVLELRAGDSLTAELKEHVKQARAFLVVLSPAAVSSEWVKRETEWALAAEDLASETGGGYRVLPVLTGGIGPGFLDWLGRPDLLAIQANGRPLRDVAPDVAQALNVLPVDARPRRALAPLAPIAELTLEFADLTFEVIDDRECVRGRLRVEYTPPKGPRGAAVSLGFESPLGAIELGELRWYVETWPSWSFGRKRMARAVEVEAALPKWGRALYNASLARARTSVEDFERGIGERRIVVQAPAPEDVEDTAIDDKERARRVTANNAAARLLALPWELLRGKQAFLFEGKWPIRVVRRIPRESALDELQSDRRILRLLLLVARASDAGWIDPRVSMTPLVAALAPLGDRVELVVPADGSLTALAEALEQADRENRPFHVVHFDGHGVYDCDRGLGQLVFEDDADCAAGKTERTARLVDAKVIGGLLYEHRIPLFVLEACQSAQADSEVTSSVAAELVAAGIGSVVAMSHSVLVETTRRFVGAFYPALARGERIGTAMVCTQGALARDPNRASPGLSRWELHDWFVPVLFQEPEGDVRLLPEAGLPPVEDVELVRRTARGKTPGAPNHGFVGRDRELLAVSRRLHHDRVVLLRGTGGLGKTALAAECARWLLDVQRVRRLAWASVELFGSVEAVLQALGSQLVAGFQVSRFESLEKARQEVERALRERPALLVVDNFESIGPSPDPYLVPMLTALAAAGETRLLVTSREPAPAGLGAVEVHVGPMDKRTGRTLVEQVLRRSGEAPKEEDDDPADGSWIDNLVAMVGGHPRSLVLLAPEVSRRGAKVTREELASLMGELERRNPGDRENSLLASVRLSLARLRKEDREKVRALAVFHGGANLGVLEHVLEVEPEKGRSLFQELVDLGLAGAEGSYLLPDPALGPAVEMDIGPRERERLEKRWLEVTRAWVRFLYEQQSQDISIAVAGVRHALGELHALVAALEAAADAGTLPVEEASLEVGCVEQLLQFGNPRALARVVAARERLGRRIAGWGRAAFLAQRLSIERQVQAGDLGRAMGEAAQLRQRALTAGPEAYQGAAYDMASSAYLLAVAQSGARRWSEALASATDAAAEFRILTKAGDRGAAMMAAKSLKSIADAKRELGHLEEAGALYEQATKESEALGDRRAAAVSRGELGTVRYMQQRYPDALTAHNKARQAFEELGELAMVAIACFESAHAHQALENLEAAERALSRSLEIYTQRGDRHGQAKVILKLGDLHLDMDRIGDSIDDCRRAADLYAEVADPVGEGNARGNLAIALYHDSRLTEARAEALRAIELKSPFGHPGQSWLSWHLLAAIEHDLNNPSAAATARTRAIDAYAAYRLDGGAPQHDTGQLIEHVLGSIAKGTPPEKIAHNLPTPPGASTSVTAFFTALRAILAGGRDPGLATDADHRYDAVVELTLLLGRLSTRSAP